MVLNYADIERYEKGIARCCKLAKRRNDQGKKKEI